jgi:hypothetical protein
MVSPQHNIVIRNKRSPFQAKNAGVKHNKEEKTPKIQDLRRLRHILDVMAGSRIIHDRHRQRRREKSVPRGDVITPLPATIDKLPGRIPATATARGPTRQSNRAD